MKKRKQVCSWKDRELIRNDKEIIKSFLIAVKMFDVGAMFYIRDPKNPHFLADAPASILQ